jgi:hypothetical protein
VSPCVADDAAAGYLAKKEFFAEDADATGVSWCSACTLVCARMSATSGARRVARARRCRAQRASRTGPP